jgi:hypothetical protein
MLLENGEPLFSRRCADEALARFVATSTKQDLLRIGSADTAADMTGGNWTREKPLTGLNALRLSERERGPAWNTETAPLNRISVSSPIRSAADCTCIRPFRLSTEESQHVKAFLSDEDVFTFF